MLASDLTTRRTHDATQVPVLLDQIDHPVASVAADGAYDSKAVYEAAQERGQGRAVRVLIPPGRNAQLSLRPSAELEERNRNIGSIREFGRREWHTRSGFDGQRVEVQMGCKILNTMTRLGMPDSYRVA